MSPRTSQQNRVLQEASKAKIVETALQLFATQGYENTTTRQIAETAGISQGLMYHYFRNKEDLLKLVYELCMAPLQSIIDGAEQQKSPEAKLTYAIHETFATLQREQVSARLFYILRSQLAFTTVLRGETLHWVNRLRDIFSQCFVAMGYKQPEVEAAILYALLEGLIRHYLLEPDDFPLDSILQRILEHYKLG